MKIEKAIEIVEGFLTLEGMEQLPPPTNALKLLIEAGKAIITYRSQNLSGMSILLPGETE